MTSRWLYFDTSVLVKLFFPEPGSEWVQQIWHEAGVVVVTSPIAFLEVQSALAKKKVRGELDNSAWAAAARHFEREMAVNLALGKAYLIPADERLLTEAVAAIHRASSEWNRILTSLDSIHLASALRLLPLGAAFVSDDKNLCDIASLFSLPIEQRNRPSGR